MRNPVTIIGGFTRRLQKRLPADDPAQEMIAPILHELRRLEQMVAEIEAFTVLLEPDIKPRDLARVLDQVLAASAGALAQRQIVLERRIPPDLPRIPLDERLFGQALGHLIDNAREAMPNGGRLRLTVTPEPKGVRLALRDTGIGIPPEDLPYLFDPFFSSKPDGTGMGLTKVHQVISDHRGEIQIKSVPGQGTEVNIWLPRWRSARPEPNGFLRRDGRRYRQSRQRMTLGLPLPKDWVNLVRAWTELRLSNHLKHIEILRFHLSNEYVVISGRVSALRMTRRLSQLRYTGEFFRGLPGSMSPWREPNRTVLSCPPVVMADLQRNFVALSVWKRVRVEGVGILDEGP